MRRTDGAMRGHRRSPWVGRLLVALLLLCGLAGRVGAHEVGTTRVVARFGGDGHFAIDVTTDAVTLVARLETGRNERRTNPGTAAALQGALDRLCGDIGGHAGVWFDSAPPAEPASTETSCRLEEDRAGADVRTRGALVTVRGEVPPDARRFRWRWDLTFTRYAMTVASSGVPGAQASEPVWLEGGDVSEPLPIEQAPIPAGASRSATVRTYVGLGFVHIVPKGLDHILFVLGIFLLSRRVRPLLWQVSAFTLAHSITLGLSLYGVARLPSSVVEPLIALSIVYVAVENLMTSQLTPWRVVLVFGFGLLHGMGFAGVLRELALPNGEFLTALVAFNVGVEAGQLTVIGGAMLLLGGWAANREIYRRTVVIPASVAIAAIGLFWTIERAMG